ncbi:tetratricopeptide repeat protein [Bacillus seohaeanensis]|jgi:tetratricopeptide (TPR) repeat protein|uniref:Tetratricopeptide repeat protein n=1 Tax=Bacillus seohaeanensis TaxID=284580 RepID=A0ABW5RS75_9BACI
MTNEKDNKRKIVYFPRLKERLLEKGVQALEEGKYGESTELLSQAYQLEPHNPDVSTALVLSLYENKNYHEAKDICKEMLLEGIGDYFEVIDMYLMILIQLNEHQEVVHTIHALFDEREVPFEKEEHFEKLLSFSEKVIKGKEEPLKVTESENGLSILTGKSLEEQTLILAQLVNQNIRPYVKELLSFLQDNTAHHFLQTMILNVLREHGLSEKVTVAKGEKQTEVIPSKLHDVFETAFFINTSKWLEEFLSHQSPTLYEQAMEIFKRHSFLLYPFEIDSDYKRIGVAYAYYVASLYEDRQVQQELDGLVDNQKDLHTVLEKIEELERVSSPTI